MKNYIFYTFLLLFVFQTEAQVGVLTLKKRETPYYGQWFTVKGQRDIMYLIEKEEFADAALQRLLAPYDIAYEDAEIDKDGDLFWVVESNNGFTSNVYRITEESNLVIIVISTNKTSDNSELNAWHENISRCVGYLF